MASVLRESTDDSAPVLTSEAGSLINVLKKVLVEGYGAQSPLGWTVMFDDLVSNECVFRANSGTRFPIKISDNRSEISYNSAFVFAYENMASVDIGYMQCPNPDDRNYACIFKSSSNSGTSPIQWKIIGDDKGFWILTRPFFNEYPTNYEYGWFWEPHYIGDYTSIPINNPYNFVTLLHHSNGYGYFRGVQYGDPLWLMRDPLTKEPGCINTYASSWHLGLTYLFGNNMNALGVSPSDGKYLYENVSIIANERPCGTLPGFLNMLWRCSSFSINTSYYNMNSQEVESFFEQDGEKKIFVFPFRDFSNSATTLGSTGNTHRGSILIGEGFRNV
jgi:hypothetical protein